MHSKNGENPKDTNYLLQIIEPNGPANMKTMGPKIFLRLLARAMATRCFWPCKEGIFVAVKPPNLKILMDKVQPTS